MGRKKRAGKGRADRGAKAVLFAVLLIYIGLIIFTVWGNTALMLHEMEIESSRLPEAFSGFRIAHISDLHDAEFGDGNEKLLDLLSRAEPDIIVITGDLVDRRHADTEKALRFVEKAAALAPTYYVSGNHEAARGDYDELREKIEDAGAAVLDDGRAVIEREGGKILLLGLKDPDFSVKGDFFGETSAMVKAKLGELMNGEDKYTVLLSHRPELFLAYVSCGVDLAFCGHAHGGQFRFPFVGGLYAPGQGFFPEYDAGLYTAGSTSMAVSRGLGNSVIPFRFNNRPEIILAVLSRA